MFLIYLAVLQGQFKHICCAPNETDPYAVQHHPFTALEHHRRQMLRLHFIDKPPKTGCNCFLLWSVLQDYNKVKYEQGLNLIRA